MQFIQNSKGKPNKTIPKLIWKNKWVKLNTHF